MLAVLGGALALLLGLAVLLLPLLLPELSRSRDSVWGALVLLLGLVLVTSAERLTGAPMLGVLCGGLLIGRLGVEVAQGRWGRLTPEEQQRLASAERWQKALAEASGAAAHLLQLASQRGAVIGTWLRERRQPRTTTKRWVRPEPTAAEEGAQAAPAEPGAPAEAPAPTEAAVPEEAAAETADQLGTPAEAPTPAEPAAAAEPEAPAQPAEEPLVVTSFEEIDALIEASEPEDSGQPDEADEDSTANPPGRTG